jgi:hydroxymethylglutaryl-CoA synthase
MEVGIVSFGAYIPMQRMQRKLIGNTWGNQGGGGEKAVANWDEDSLTMAVEACLDCLRGRPRDADGILFASTTAPYREKQSASIMRKVLDLGPECFTMDAANSLRGGTTVFRAALDMARASPGQTYLAAAADLRMPAPASSLELAFGDGAAALLVGSEDVIARVNAHRSYSSEFIDLWRRDKDTYTQIWEDRYVLSEGYEKILGESLAAFLASLNAAPGDYARAAVSAPGAGALRAVCRKTGFTYGTQVSGRLFDSVGNTGSAQALMMLVEVLETAAPGERILLAAYGDGVDLFDLTVTERITSLPRGRGIAGHLASRLPLESYGRYLRFRDLMEWEFDRRPPDRSSLAVIARESGQIYSLHGARCRRCGTVQYPVQRICTECRSKDDFEEIRLADRKGKLFTFSMDERAMVPDLPNVLCIVDLEGGGRFYSVLTDRTPAEVTIGMPVELTFRKIHEGSNLYNYFWKARPVRG